MRGEHQHRDIARVADPREQFPAIQRRQPDVEQDRVLAPVMKSLQPVPAVGGGC